MLQSDLRELNSTLETLRKHRNAEAQAEEENKLEKEFEAISTKIISAYETAVDLNNEFSYDVDDTYPNSKPRYELSILLKNVSRCMDIGFKVSDINAIKLQYSECEKQLKDIWENDFYPEFEEKKSLLDLLNNVIEDSADVQQCLDIVNHSRNLVSLIENRTGRDDLCIVVLNETGKRMDELVKSTNADHEVLSFLKAVNNRSVTINALTPKVITWITDNHLGGKFGVVPFADMKKLVSGKR